MLSLWEVTRVAIDAASHLVTVQLRGDGDEGDHANAVPEDDAPVLSQLGVAVRPVVTSTLRALGYQDDDVWVLKLWDKARSPTDLAEGETRLFCAGTIARMIRLLANRIDVEAPRINLGAAATKGVARELDSVDCGTLALVCAAGGGQFTITGQWVPPGGGAPVSVGVMTVVDATVVSGTGTVTVPLVGRITTGSNKVKAED